MILHKIAPCLGRENIVGWNNTKWDYVDIDSYPVLRTNVADATEQSVYQVAGLLRLADAIGN